MFENQVTYQYIGKADVDTLANGVKVTKASDITVGALVVLDAENKAVQGTAATGRVRIAQRIGNQLIYSPFFDMAKITNPIHEDYVAPVEQVSYVGYNGTTGSLDGVANKLVVMQVILQHTMATLNNSPMIKTVPYKTVGATQAELALGLVNSANSVFNKRTTPDSLIKFERTMDEAGAVLGTSVDTLTFTKGSKYFSADDIDDATGAGTVLTLGDYLKIPSRDDMEITLTGASGTAIVAIVGTGLSHTATFNSSLTTTASDFVTANAAAYLAVGLTLTSAAAVLTIVKANKSAISAAVGTATNATGDLAGTALWGTNLTDAVYAITAINTTTNIGTLDTEFRSDSFAAEDDSFTRIDSATALAAEMGIRMIGLAPSSFNPIVDTYQKVEFKITSDDFVTMEFTTADEPIKGVGTFEQVAVQEIYSAMNEGQGRFLSTYPPTTYRQEANVDTEYDLITFGGLDDAFSDIVGNNPKSTQNFILALFKDSTQFTSLKTVLGSSAA